MISIIIFIVCVLLGSTLGIRLAIASTGGSFIPKALKPKKKTPNYEFIEQADREIFGIEPNGERPQDTPKQIEGLAGYRTRLRKDSDGDLELTLIDSKGNAVEHGYIYAHDYADNYARSKTTLTPAMLEKKVQAKFETMVKTQRAKVAQEAAMKGLIEKFNNKAIES